MENEVKEPVPKYNYVSVADYLTMERSSLEKHEYYRGEVFAMSGASWNHNVIARNVNTIVLPILKGKSCSMYGSDLRIHIPENTLYTYPDFSIICGAPETTDEEKDTVIKPVAIIEILSPTTKSYDRGDKFNLYRQISILQEYILIDSETVSVEHFVKQSVNEWILTEIKDISKSFNIQTVDIPVTLQELYIDIKF